MKRNKYYGEEWPEGHRRCLECEEILPFDRFGKHTGQKFDIATRCKECRRPISAAHYDKWMKKNPTRRLYTWAQRRAKKDNIPFDITEEDIVIPDVCPVFGFPLEVNTGEKGKYNSPSLDKFVPELGYVKGNIQVISFRANWIKQNASVEEIEALAKWMRSVV